MKNLSVKEFSKIYKGLHLLTRSNEAIQLGDLYDKVGFFNRRVDFHGYNIAYKLNLNQQEAADLKERLDNIEYYSGSFAGMSIKDDFSKEGEMEIPGIKTSFTNNIDKSKVLGFEIGEIKTKILRDGIRYEIEQLIEDLREETRKEYRKELKGLFVVEQLFYSESIKVTVHKDISIDVEAAVAESMANVSQSIDSSKNHVFTFQGSDYPFAVDLEKINEFI